VVVTSREVTQLRAPCSPAAAVGGHQGSASPLQARLPLPPDARGPDGQPGLAHGTWAPPAGETAPSHAEGMGGPRHASAAAPGRLVVQLTTASQEARPHDCDTRLAVAQALHVGGFVLQIASDGPVCTGLVGRTAPGPSAREMVRTADDPTGGHACTRARRA
jgi:hypothetical protein